MLMQDRVKATRCGKAIRKRKWRHFGISLFVQHFCVYTLQLWSVRSGHRAEAVDDRLTTNGGSLKRICAEFCMCRVIGIRRVCAHAYQSNSDMFRYTGLCHFSGFCSSRARGYCGVRQCAALCQQPRSFCPHHCRNCRCGSNWTNGGYPKANCCCSKVAEGSISASAVVNLS